MMITETATNIVLAGGGGGGGKIKRPSFKSRSGVNGSVRGYRAVRVTVPSTVVTELASKFNAVVVDADRGATARDIIKKVNKTLAKGAAVRATVEKFEAAEKSHVGNHMIVVRTNSGHQLTNAVAEKRSSWSSSSSSSSSSIVKRRMEQFQHDKRPPKPSVLGPKPNVANLRREGQLKKVSSKDSVTATAVPSKHKRLSIARDPDAQLECVLNATTTATTTAAAALPDASRPPGRPEPQQEEREQRMDTGQPSATEQRSAEQQQEEREQRMDTLPEVLPKPNNSFLHGRKRPSAADDDGGGGGQRRSQPRTPSPIAANGVGRPTSFLHAYKENLSADCSYFADGEQSQAIYEELCDVQKSTGQAAEAPGFEDVVLESSYYDHANDHHYTTIEGGEQNIYDDVIMAADDVQVAQIRSPAEDDTSYETVEVPPPPPPPLFPVDDSGSDRLSKKELSGSWVEIDNSIYGLNPPSESTSSGMISDCVSAISADQNGKYDLDEEWVDEDNTSDELQEIIVFHEKPNMNEIISKGWTMQVQKQLTKAYESKDIHQDIPEEIYADYDSFDSDDSWDDCKVREKVTRVPYPCENRDLPAPPSRQNIYGFVPMVKRAGNRMKKRWSLGSLGINRIRKLNVGNFTTDLGNKNYDNTISDKSIDKIPSKKCNSLSSSVFYINDPVYNNIENDEIHAMKTRKPPSSIDSRRLSVATRPSSPPPPPPSINKRHSTGINSYSSLNLSICNSIGRTDTLDKSNSESISENGSTPGSDLYMRFADEPLYQFYAADISERSKSVFVGDVMEECDGYEEISSITSRPSALELITPSSSGYGQHRSLWCEVPEVKNSGIIDALKPRERKLQEVKFELITSEASYFKSLTVLEKHFVNSHSMNDETILNKNDRKILFGNVNPVRKCSEKLLAALEKCWQDNILLKGLCEILYTHAKENFQIFVKYCSNQIYIDRTLKSLKEKNFKFNEALQTLESDPKCQSLSLHSFLMLPMQRITRLPLLVDAILSQMDSTENSLEYQMCELTLASLNNIVQNCNESTRKLERYEEMLLLSQQLEFSNKKEMKAMSVASSSRWLVRSGSMLHLTSPDVKLTFSRKLIRPTKLYFFLFNDMFFIAKRKSDENYTVIDYCARNFIQMVDATELVISSSYKNLLMLTILENHEAKTVEMLLSCDSESSKKRWIEAMSSPISSNPDETLYNEWDCPQVFAKHAYTADQPDELSLQNGDIVKVLTKMNDGWYHGERIRDGEKGWFPGNYTSEIASQHARAKNLKQRYRLLAMSGSYLQSQQDKIKKK